jgi:hypothetical protein
VLQLLLPTLAALVTATSSPPLPVVITAARYVTILPLLGQRLRVLARQVPTKGWHQQLSASQAIVPTPSLLAPLQSIPAFMEAQTYFQAIAGAMHAVLATPPAGALRLPDESAPPQRRPPQRRAKTPRPEKRLRHIPPGFL